MCTILFVLYRAMHFTSIAIVVILNCIRCALKSHISVTRTNTLNPRDVFENIFQVNFINNFPSKYLCIKNFYWNRWLTLEIRNQLRQVAGLFLRWAWTNYISLWIHRNLIWNRHFGFESKSGTHSSKWLSHKIGQISSKIHQSHSYISMMA